MRARGEWVTAGASGTISTDAAAGRGEGIYMIDNSAGADREVRRRRIRFRAWHRGIREMDLVMGGFADAALAGMSDDELDQFEQLLDLPDPQVFAWVVGIEPVPPGEDVPLLAKLRAFRVHEAPMHV
jgi:antitoxin CptB